MSNSNKLTKDLEEYFFASSCSDDHEINDYVLWCCWKMGYFQSIYEQEPFSNLNEFQQLTFEGLVSIHFDQKKNSNKSLSEQQNIHSSSTSLLNIHYIYILLCLHSSVLILSAFFTRK